MTTRATSRASVRSRENFFISLFQTLKKRLTLVLLLCIFCRCVVFEEEEWFLLVKPLSVANGVQSISSSVAGLMLKVEFDEWGFGFRSIPTFVRGAVKRIDAGCVAE